jgi:hypothetical protein
MGRAQQIAAKNDGDEFLRMELSPKVRVCGRGIKDRGPTVRGFPRRLGNFSLRDMVPPGAFRRARAKDQAGVPVDTQPKKTQTGTRTKPRVWLQLRADRRSAAAPGTDSAVPDRHVLDYRMLEGLRLVFGEIYADH